MHSKLRVVPLLFVLLTSTALGAGPTTTTAPAVDFDKQVLPILNNYCVSCHSGDDPKGDTYLSFKNEKEARDVMKSDKGLWPAVVRMVTSKEMPPTRAPKKPSDDERNILINWVNSNVLGLGQTSEPNPGRFLVHRLNNREYANTIRDLLYLPADWDASADFPADDGVRHDHYNCATIIAGRGGGTLDPGRHIRYDRQPMCNLWLSLMDRMGVQLERHGDSTGRLPGLTV